MLRVRLALACALTFSALSPALAQDTQRLRTDKVEVIVETVARNLQNPWGLAFLPDGRMLVTERPGRLRIADADGSLSEPLQGVPRVAARGQGGLLDVALDPNFAQNRLVYLSFAEDRGEGRAGTSVARGRLSQNGSALEAVQVIFRQEPTHTGNNHWGSRLVFDRDGNLFVTLGDRFDLRNQAQNPANHLGKIVRIKPNGGAAPNNPFLNREDAKPEIWSLGHSNLQSAALHPTTGELWTVEHGARGGDEVNIPQKGKNYGWPIISYGVDYSGAKIGEGTEKNGAGAAGLLLGPVHRPVRHGLLHRRQVPGLARQHSRRRARRQARLAARDQRQPGDGRGAHAAESRRAHPRRAPGSGWLRLSPHRFPRRTHPADEARDLTDCRREARTA